MEQPWFHEGLNFTCTRCGQCCTGQPGYVWVNDAEILNIAEFLDVSVEEVIQKFTRRLHGKRSLTEKPNYDCIFWEAEVGCQIYPARPTQCRTWPFWESNLRKPSDWEYTKSVCPGSGQGELIPVEEILSRMKQVKM